MQVILKEKIRNLGDLGECVKVKPGYARNFLIPQGKAMMATKNNLAVFEAERAALEKLANERLSAAQAMASKLESFNLAVQAKAGDGGKLFGSIGSRDIADALVSRDIAVQKHQVRLPNGVIRELGEFDVELHLHTDVDVLIKVTVQPV